MKKWIGIALIAIMFLSSIAFAIIQAFSLPQQPQQQQQTAELPADFILDYKLTQAQYDEALSRGFTVMTYRYDDNCSECFAERNLLEQIVMSKEFSGQIILEEVKESSDVKLEMTSFAGAKSFNNIDQNEITKALCDLVVNPPLGCINLSTQ